MPNGGSDICGLTPLMSLPPFGIRYLAKEQECGDVGNCKKSDAFTQSNQSEKACASGCAHHRNVPRPGRNLVASQTPSGGGGAGERIVCTGVYLAHRF